MKILFLALIVSFIVACGGGGGSTPQQKAAQLSPTIRVDDVGSVNAYIRPYWDDKTPQQPTDILFLGVSVNRLGGVSKLNYSGIRVSILDGGGNVLFTTPEIAGSMMYPTWSKGFTYDIPQDPAAVSVRFEPGWELSGQ